MNGEIEIVRNVYGCAIKRCCASCKHKDIDLEGLHICNLMGLKVQHKFKCSQWQMSAGLTKAGSAQGVVRDIFTKRTIIE
jgi:hypothetical protein